ncbi:MAG: DegT/DnrJ/EryC1/StrS family aminotransferase [Sedimentisphaerales bacterium]|nr:DegT/DnrJ/EryC1/StrS family aminotransferase [Sedimentisphaerales bacterium]
MRTSYSRRSFLKQSSAALAAAGTATGAARTLYAQAAGSANTLALLGGTPVRTKGFSKVWPIFDQNEEQALVQALRSRNWCCLRGNVVYDFEKNFARDMGASQCVLSNGGTTALGASLQCLGVGAGDEVITSPHTFIATINVMTNLHALPVFVDIDPDTGSIDADRIEAAITENTRAIVPVHLSGFPADIRKIMTIADKYKIPVVEDACQSVYAEVDGQKVGTFGATGCISFQEWKSLVSGEGGAILGSDKELMRRCAAFVNNGRDPDKEKSGYPFPGSNHRMTEFQAAVLTEQYKRFKEQDRIRQQNGRYVEGELAKIPGLKPRKRYSPNTRITYFYFEMDYDRNRFKGVSASDFAKAVRAEGIPISGGPRQYGGGCHREGMLEEHLRSRGFERAFSRARLDQYRASLRLPVMDGLTENKRERLSAETKIVFLGTKQDMDEIIEAFHKVARNIDTLARV